MQRNRRRPRRATKPAFATVGKGHNPDIACQIESVLIHLRGDKPGLCWAEIRVGHYRWINVNIYWKSTVRARFEAILREDRLA
jgi:hypothetical protein